jgi:hypothetical protein
MDVLNAEMRYFNVPGQPQPGSHESAYSNRTLTPAEEARGTEEYRQDFLAYARGGVPTRLLNTGGLETRDTALGLTGQGEYLIPVGSI